MSVHQLSRKYRSPWYLCPTNITIVPSTSLVLQSTNPNSKYPVCGVPYQSYLYRRNANNSPILNPVKDSSLFYVVYCPTLTALFVFDDIDDYSPDALLAMYNNDDISSINNFNMIQCSKQNQGYAISNDYGFSTPTAKQVYKGITYISDKAVQTVNQLTSCHLVPIHPQMKKTKQGILKKMFSKIFKK